MCLASVDYLRHVLHIFYRLANADRKIKSLFDKINNAIC